MTEEKLDKLAEKYQDDNTIIRYYGPGNGSVPEYNKTMAEVFKDGWNACKEQMMKEFETWLKGNLHHLSCWNVDEFCTDLKCYLGMKNE